MTPELLKYIDALRRQVALERKDTIRRPVTSARREEAVVGLSDLKVVRRIQLRITEEGNGADAEDIGKFWFVPGYSLVGGPDIVRES